MWGGVRCVEEGFASSFIFISHENEITWYEAKLFHFHGIFKKTEGDSGVQANPWTPLVPPLRSDGC